MNSTKNISLIYLANFFVSFSYGLFLLLPVFVNSLGGNELDAGRLILWSGVGTVACILITKRLMRYVRSHWLGMLGAIFYAVGALIFALMHSLTHFLILPALLLGAGWGVCYNTAPACLSQFVTQDDRARAFSFVSAFAVLGTCFAPTIVNWLDLKTEFTWIFGAAVLTSLISAFFYALISGEPEPLGTPPKRAAHLSFLAFIKSPVMFPIIMVFLGACAFTVMMNFQATYADSLGLNYADFYVSYSLAVVISRFFISPLLKRFNPFKAAIVLVFIMCLGILVFAQVAHHHLLYTLAGVLFGVGYGLTYPHIQAIAVSLTEERFHKDVISTFSLSYFIAVYAFPVLAGKLIIDSGYAVASSVLIGILLLDLVFAGLQYCVCRNKKSRRM